MHQIQRYFRKAGKAILRFFTRVAHGSVLDIAILVCGVAVVGAGTAIAVVSSQNGQIPVDVSSAVPITTPSSVSAAPPAQEQYDPNENALQLSEYDGTLLTETTDGGEAYLKETIFIGDSNTYRLATYSLTSWQNNLSAVGMGIQHVTGTPSMYFKGMADPVYMARAVAMMQPRRIVITYGTNNTDSAVDTFKNQYRSALEAIKKEWPYADIIINAIPPVAIFRANAAATQKSIDAFNKALADLAREDGYQFLNSSEVLKDPTTGFARTDYMIGDGLHLNEDGAKALMGYVRTHTHIVADTRPALTELPLHQPTPEALFNPQAASSSSSSSGSEAEGVTVNFIVRGDKNGGTLAGTLMQLVAPGKACTPVTATANAGYTMSWGCDAGGLYEGQGITTSGNQSTAVYTVPSNATKDKALNVWVTFTKHEHTYDVWKDQNNGNHARYCSDPKCPDEHKGVETGAHTWNTDPNTGSRTCTVCGAKGEKDPNWTCTSHTYENGKCTKCGAACAHSAHGQDSRCTTCGMGVEHNYDPATHLCSCGLQDPGWQPHSHTPSSCTNNGNGTHSVRACTDPNCSEYNNVTTTKCVFTGGKCVCGAEKPSETPPEGTGTTTTSPPPVENPQT